MAGECVFGVCVGHEQELHDVCVAGLDLAASKLHEQLAALRFDVLRFHSGSADVRGGQLTGGVWEASLDLGAGPRSVHATFTGAR